MPEYLAAEGRGRRATTDNGLKSGRNIETEGSKFKLKIITKIINLRGNS